jgi:hypothetical protein
MTCNGRSDFAAVRKRPPAEAELLDGITRKNFLSTSGIIYDSRYTIYEQIAWTAYIASLRPFAMRINEMNMTAIPKIANADKQILDAEFRLINLLWRRIIVAEQTRSDERSGYEQKFPQRMPSLPEKQACEQH